jgi:hypothetical protein
MSGALSGKNRKYHADETYEILSNTYNIAVTPPGGIQGAITIPNGFFECLRNAHHSAQLSEIPFTGGFESRSPASFL